jgi:hypothetical protein
VCQHDAVLHSLDHVGRRAHAQQQPASSCMLPFSTPSVGLVSASAHARPQQQLVIGRCSRRAGLFPWLQRDL